MENRLLKQLYQKYQKEIYLYLYSLCKNRELAEDLTQETFLKAILSLPNEHTNVRAWLYMVGRNLYFNYRKKEGKEFALEEVDETVSDGAETDRMSLDMAVYSELFLPGHYADFVISDARGYGVHDIEIHSGMNKVAGKIDKNKLILYDMSVLNRPVVNCVYPQKANVFYSYILEDIEEQSKNMLDALQQLEDNKQYGVYVTFSDVYNYSELKQWSKENDLIFPQWCAICRKDEFETEGSATPYSADELIGFINGGSAHSMFYDKELYPNLTQYDLLETTSEEKDWEISEEDMTTHVISILQYMKDQEVFNEMVGLEQQCRVFDTYQQLIDSIKNNGLIIYGFYGEATKEEILALSKSDDVAYIYTVPVE